MKEIKAEVIGIETIIPKETFILGRVGGGGGGRGREEAFDRGEQCRKYKIQMRLKPRHPEAIYVFSKPTAKLALPTSNNGILLEVSWARV